MRRLVYFTLIWAFFLGGLPLVWDHVLLGGSLLVVGCIFLADLFHSSSNPTVAYLASSGEVKVRPVSTASFLASARSLSSSRTVVLMHQSISPRHQYVKNDWKEVM